MQRSSASFFEVFATKLSYLLTWQNSGKRTLLALLLISVTAVAANATASAADLYYDNLYYFAPLIVSLLSLIIGYRTTRNTQSAVEQSLSFYAYALRSTAALTLLVFALSFYYLDIFNFAVIFWSIIFIIGLLTISFSLGVLLRKINSLFIGLGLIILALGVVSDAVLVLGKLVDSIYLSSSVDPIEIILSLSMLFLGFILLLIAETQQSTVRNKRFLNFALNKLDARYLLPGEAVSVLAVSLRSTWYLRRLLILVLTAAVVLLITNSNSASVLIFVATTLSIINAAMLVKASEGAEVITTWSNRRAKVYGLTFVSSAISLLFCALLFNTVAQLNHFVFSAIFSVLCAATISTATIDTSRYLSYSVVFSIIFVSVAAAFSVFDITINEIGLAAAWLISLFVLQSLLLRNKLQ